MSQPSDHAPDPTVAAADSATAETAPAQPAPGRIPKVPFWAQILLGLVLGVVLGWVARSGDVALARYDARPRSATIFVQLLKLAVAPLVFFAILISITNLRNVQQRRAARHPHAAVVHGHLADRGRHRPRHRPAHQPGRRHRPHRRRRRQAGGGRVLAGLPHRHHPDGRHHAVHRTQGAADRLHGRRRRRRRPQARREGRSRSSASASPCWSCSRRPCGGSSASPRSAPSASSAPRSPTTAGT